ncbi:unnamed protein product [Polarella glacialis]|uniref:Uncharacterized protein n=1 Tax=Polarella glacialis TaxID=89957 RepID=A0A813HPK8_POLGL|nr:unnamed protein product [Polarella glacialis]
MDYHSSLKQRHFSCPAEVAKAYAQGGRLDDRFFRDLSETWASTAVRKMVPRAGFGASGCQQMTLRCLWCCCCCCCCWFGTVGIVDVVVLPPEMKADNYSDM